MPFVLKHRERQVLTFLANGLTAPQIAERLSLSVETVRWYIKQLYRQLNVSSRGEAVRVAMTQGMLDAPAPAVTGTPVTRSEIRYVQNQGAHLAYQVVGDGPVDLLFVHGFVSHLDIAWDNPEYQQFFEHVGQYARIILFDKRGVGVSDRDVETSTLEQTVHDARAILDATGSTQAFIMGTSESGAAAVLMASMFATRVRGLILFGASPFIGGHGREFPWTDDHGARTPLKLPNAADWGDSWEIERFAPSRAADRGFNTWWSRLMRAATSPSAVATVLTHARSVDIRALLPSVQLPALILHRAGDRLVPVTAGRYLAAMLPQARLIELPGHDHIYFVEHTQYIDHITDFLQQTQRTEEPRTWLAIILCMCGSAATLNDATRTILGSHGAKYLRHSQHAWTALFEGPSAAIQAARALRRARTARDVGMALHVGACAVSDGVPAGAAYARVHHAASAATAGEIVITGTLRDILAGANVNVAAHSIAVGDDALAASANWVLQD